MFPLLIIQMVDKFPGFIHQRNSRQVILSLIIFQHAQVMPKQTTAFYFREYS